MRSFTKSDIAMIAFRQGEEIDEQWSGVGAVWPLLEAIMADGCIVIVKLDGERRPASGDNGPYSLLATGGPLRDTPLRGDFYDLDDGLCYLIGNYYDRDAN